MTKKRLFIMLSFVMLSLMVSIASAQPPQPTPPPADFTPEPPTPIAPSPTVTPTQPRIEATPTLRGGNVNPSPTIPVLASPTPDFPTTDFMPLAPTAGRTFITRENLAEVVLLARIVPPNYYDGFGLVGVEFSPDGRYILISGNQGAVHLYDSSALRRGEVEPLFSFTHGSQTVWDVAFHPYLDQFAVCSADGFIAVKYLDGTSLQEISAPTAATQCNYSPKGDLFGYSGGNEAYRYFVDEYGTLTFDENASYSESSVHDVIFSGRGTILYTSGTNGVTAHTMDGDSILWHSVDTNVWSVNPLPNGNLLATGSGGLVVLLNADGEEIIRYDGHANDVIESAYSPDGDILVTGSWDNELLFWDGMGESAEALISLNHGEYIVDVAWSRDGALVASVGNNGHLLLWGIP